jgi:hypothetical protein
VSEYSWLLVFQVWIRMRIDVALLWIE